MPSSHHPHYGYERGNTVYNLVSLTQGTTKDRFLHQEMWVLGVGVNGAQTLQLNAIFLPGENPTTAQ